MWLRVRFAEVRAEPLEVDVDGVHQVCILDGLGLIERLGKPRAVHGDEDDDLTASVELTCLA